MTEYSATRALRADAKTVRDILVDTSRLPDWNPAVRSVTTTDREAIVGRKYPTVTRLPGRASLTYTRIEPGGVDWRLEAPGAIEVGRWRITSLGNATAVTHTMAHSGPIFV
ncbi:MAG TPA: SRPBCC family protein, partial [Leifsonia sp.]